MRVFVHFAYCNTDTTITLQETCILYFTVSNMDVNSGNLYVTGAFVPIFQTVIEEDKGETT